MSGARGFSLLERFELKYHIPVEWADRIARFIAPYCEEDHYSQITPGAFYYITNLYLDSPSWTFFNWRKQGLHDRFNMRIRTYGEHPDPLGAFHFEVKRKLGRVCFKSRATLQGHLPGLVFHTPPEQWGTKDKDTRYLNDFLMRTLQYDARPRLLTQYKRRAWFGVTEDYSRVTIDTGMRFREENGFDYTVEQSRMHDSGLPRYFAPGTDAVLELKCPTTQVPYWMIDLIRTFNLKQGGFSKFGAAAIEYQAMYGDSPRSLRTAAHA